MREFFVERTRKKIVFISLWGFFLIVYCLPWLSQFLLSFQQKMDPKICGVNIHHCHFYHGRGYLFPSFFTLARFHCSALSCVVDNWDVATEIKPSVTNKPTVHPTLSNLASLCRLQRAEVNVLWSRKAQVLTALTLGRSPKTDVALP